MPRTFDLHPSPPRANQIINTPQVIPTPAGPMWVPINTGTAGGGAIIRNFIGPNEYITVQQYSQFIVVDELINEGELIVEDGGVVAIL